ncbi:malonyl-CoA synthase [Jannaschia sp. Os4]|uniref:malonate--CoA ligase n=1 Tax=Jannaschia sp. Os4 TaxID=2807617 RepID=UPI001939AE86|nr:malonyl-CoA synthase [Jannaschia sp. Os4]MBM2578037.1 malonyl-CoA synthase [Jannaschia sp. Os4]
MTANHGYDALVGRHAGSDRPFLRAPDGTAWSYADFADRAARLAGALASHGLRPGDRIAVQVAKHPDALALYAASLRGGHVFLPLNTAYTAAELDHFVGDSGAALVVCDPDTHEAVAPVADRFGARTATLAALAADADGADPAPVAARAPDDLAAILYTSGTTGRSKGAMLTHDNLLSNAATLKDAWRFTADDVLIHALPIFHTHGLFVATNVTLAAGSSMIFHDRYDPDAILAAMPEATAMMGVPTFYTRLLDHPGLTREATGGMRLFVSGSAPMLAETHRAWTDRTGHRILERYGMTETNMNTSNPYDGDRRPGTVGLPLPGVEVRVVDGDRAPVPAGETGMIEVRGPNVFPGYWNLPEKTAEELGPDGWFVTGDLGVLSDDGYLSIVGRQKDLVITGGYNVYPKEVEEALDDQPGVLESAVFGVAHPDMGEGVVAVVVPEAGAAPDPDALRAALEDRLARFKQPRRIEVIDALPRNAMGKVQKAALRERYADSFA